MNFSTSQLIYLGGRIGDSLGSVSEFQSSGFGVLVESKGEWPYDFSINRIWGTVHFRLTYINLLKH